MGQSTSRVQPFTESEQVYDLPHSKPPKSSPDMTEKHHPHRPDEKPVDDGEGTVLPTSPLKEEKKSNKKKVGHFFKWFSSRLRKKITKSKSSGQGEMKDQDQKPQQPICRSVEVTDLEEPHTSVLQVPPAAEPLVQKDLQTQVHDAPVSVRAGEVSPLMIELDSNEVDTRPEDNICCRYAIGSKLGQGGFGAVYKATRLEDRLKVHQVAVKFVKKTKHTEYISIPDHPKPLPKEVALTILANKDPVMDIIRLLDWQDQQNFYVIVVQRFSHCMDVFRFVQRNGGSIDEKLARLIMFGATLAASACCRRGVYHGDIKLENLLINLENLQIKLIDFGCGSVLTESAYTRFSGTVMYRPPEYILKGEFHGKPATVWSLGILLFRMLCGHFPDSFDFYRINLNTWSKPGLTEGEFLFTSTILQQNFIGDGHMDNPADFTV
ncbi:probable serine/threonine-protein kinase MARK-A [Carassius carassius]|uniref:probable serine/threonine-protein kinase MARK-A n=1 Tax=Carassius carassius TaxID=217509 RepID=UPI002868BFAC|nr:probable serine/threonine-protein kinase MARK-A [Carassius carassius]